MSGLTPAMVQEWERDLAEAASLAEAGAAAVYRPHEVRIGRAFLPDGSTVWGEVIARWPDATKPGYRVAVKFPGAFGASHYDEAAGTYSEVRE
jgi:hypothetical protein